MEGLPQGIGGEIPKRGGEGSAHSAEPEKIHKKIGQKIVRILMFL